VSIHPQINAQAYTALLAGAQALHDELVRESAIKVSGSNPVGHAVYMGAIEDR
jgi:hypothetical protein